MRTWGTRTGRLAAVALALLVSVIGACADRVTGDDQADMPALLVRVGGDWQTAPRRASLDSALAIRAIDPVSLSPIAGLRIHFALRRPDGGAVLGDTIAVTDRDGVARTTVTLGDQLVNEVKIDARGGAARPEQFTVRVAEPPVLERIGTSAMRSGDTITLFGRGLAFVANGGRVRFGSTPVAPVWIGDTALRVVVPPCLSPGMVGVTVTKGGVRTETREVNYTLTRAPLALAPFEGTLVNAQALDACIVLPPGTGQYLVVAQWENGTLTPDSLEVTLGADNDVSSAFRAAETAQSRRDATPLAFDAMLRSRERTLPGANLRASVRSSAPLPVLGDTRSFMVISKLDASAFDTITTRLRFAGNHILVWADTSSTPDLDDAELRAVSTLFDTELYQLDQDMFGEPSDVDGNGRIHVVLTPVVNGLIARNQCTASGFVSGFFSAHDLYAGTKNANGGEVFYGIVPDSAGTYGCSHPASEFSRVIRTAFVHEFQHVINFNQHVLLRGGKEEEVWLNEGLSHIAEENASNLYERRFPPPMGRNDPNQIFPDSSQNFIIFNLVNSFLFLHQTHATSLTHFMEGGTLEERGGMWLFLRWLGDQYGESIYRRLVQTSVTGKANVAQKTGEPFLRLEGDFSLAVFADSLPGVPRTAVPARWRFASRNWRVIYQRLNVINNFPSFPIVPYGITPGQSISGYLRAGGFVYSVVATTPAAGTVLRFIPRDGSAWGAREAQVSILRLN